MQNKRRSVVILDQSTWRREPLCMAHHFTQSNKKN